MKNIRVIIKKPTIDSILSKWWNGQVCKGQGSDLGMLVFIALNESDKYWIGKRRKHEKNNLGNACEHNWHLFRNRNPLNSDKADFICDICGKMKSVIIQWRKYNVDE